MKIQRIHLKGYKPLALNNIDIIDIEFKNIIALVLGTNGSGKSSLLRECTPLPAAFNNYREGGIKQITIEFKNSIYVLTSSIGKTARHSFVKDGNVINDMVTSTLQRETVIKEFGYTPLIHKLLLGEIKFTQLTPASRRELLTTITPNNIEYLIGLHQSIKDNIRETITVLKHVTKKKHDAEIQLHDIAVNDDNTTLKKTIEQTLETLIPYIGNKSEAIDIINSRIKTKLDEVPLLISQLKKFDNTHLSVNYLSSVDEVNVYIGSLLNRLQQNKINHSTVTTELYRINETLNQLTDDISITDIGIKINTLTDNIKKLQDPRFTKYIDLDLSKLLQRLHSTYDDVSGIANTVSCIAAVAITDIPEIKSMFNKLIDEKTSVENTITRITEKLIHLTDGHDTVICNGCQNQITLKGESVKDIITRLTTDLNFNNTKLEELSQRVYKSTNLYDTCITLEKALSYLYNIKKSSMLPIDFWMQFDNDSDILFSGKINTILSIWINKLNDLNRSLDYQTEVQKLINVNVLLSEYGTDIFTKKKALITQIETLLTEGDYLQREVTRTKSILKNIHKYTSLYERIVQLNLSIQQDIQLLQESIIYHDAKGRTSDLHGQLYVINDAINKRETITNQINILQKEIKTLESRQQHLILLEQTLSPNKGLIADQMLQFIGTYVTNMNQYLNQLWEYKLNIGLCKCDEGSLDYYFPILVEQEVIKDVNEGSQSQKEIVDLVFILVLRHCLQLDMFPLYLDETGATFDEQHRSKLVTFINNYVNSKQCSQVFIVNHYISTYGGFINNDVIVLDDRNIIIPGVYNETVKILFSGQSN